MFFYLKGCYFKGYFHRLKKKLEIPYYFSFPPSARPSLCPEFYLVWGKGSLDRERCLRQHLGVVCHLAWLQLAGCWHGISTLDDTLRGFLSQTLPQETEGENIGEFGYKMERMVLLKVQKSTVQLTALCVSPQTLRYWIVSHWLQLGIECEIKQQNL